MKAIICLLLISFVPAICLLSWIGFPLSPSITGTHFPLLRQLRLPSQASLLSYGSLSALVLLLGADAVRRRNQRLLCLAAATLLVLVVSAPLQVAFGDPLLLDRLAREADWQHRAIKFSRQFLPANLGSEATTWSTLPLNTVAERLIAGWYFMGLSWYVSLVAALLLIVIALNSLARRSQVQFGLLAGMVLFFTSLFFLKGPLIAQHAFVEGIRNVARGDLIDARRHYLEAEEYDRWDGLQIDFRERLGTVDTSLGRTGSPEARIFVAEQMVDRGRTLEAIAEYQKLATSHAEVAAVAQSRLTDLLTYLGLQFYEIGSFGRAVDAWHQAFTYDSSNYLAAFFLTRGYFAIGMYQEAANIAGKFLNTSDPVLRANLYCNWADARIREGSQPRAHIAYKRAYDLAYTVDRRALQSLVGP
jgi:tetratricopeptide (TPR) repeat protein